jgi:hypothetical protein
MIVSKALLFVRKNWKNIAIVLAALIVFFSIKGCLTNASKVKELSKAMEWKQKFHESELKEWKDKNKEAHIEVDNLFVEHFALLDELDSIGGLLKIKPKQIISFSQSTTTIGVHEKPHVDSVIIKVPISQEHADSFSVVSQYDFHWIGKDSSLVVWGTVGSGKEIVNVYGIDTLSRTDYWKRKWFLGAKHYYSDFHHTNDYIRFVGYKGAQLKEKEKRWSVSVGGGFGYPIQSFQFNKPVPFIGVYAGYSLFRF